MILRFIKSVFLAVSNLRRQLTTQNLKSVSLDDQLCMTSPTLIDLNSEFKICSEF